MKGEIISINTARQCGKTYKLLLDMQKENIALRDELKKIKKDLELKEIQINKAIEYVYRRDIYFGSYDYYYLLWILERSKNNV